MCDMVIKKQGKDVIAQYVKASKVVNVVIIALVHSLINGTPLFGG